MSPHATLMAPMTGGTALKAYAFVKITLHGKESPQILVSSGQNCSEKCDFSALCKTPVAQKMTTGFGGLANKLSSFARLQGVVGEKV